MLPTVPDPGDKSCEDRLCPTGTRCRRRYLAVPENRNAVRSPAELSPRAKSCLLNTNKWRQVCRQPSLSRHPLRVAGRRRITANRYTAPSDLIALRLIASHTMSRWKMWFNSQESSDCYEIINRLKSGGFPKNPAIQIAPEKTRDVRPPLSIVTGMTL